MKENKMFKELVDHYVLQANSQRYEDVRIAVHPEYWDQAMTEVAGITHQSNATEFIYEGLTVVRSSEYRGIKVWLDFNMVGVDQGGDDEITMFEVYRGNDETISVTDNIGKITVSKGNKS